MKDENLVILVMHKSLQKIEMMEFYMQFEQTYWNLNRKTIIIIYTTCSGFSHHHIKSQKREEDKEFNEQDRNNV